MTDSQYLQLIEGLEAEDKLKQWIRECCYCKTREVFETAPNELCQACGASTMRITREIPREELIK